MHPPRPLVAVADAIPHPAPEPEARPATTARPAAAGPPGAPAPAPALEASPPPARGGVRGWISALLRRPAAYARAYLTASLEHQLALQARRTVDLAGAVQRVEQRADASAAEAHARDLRQEVAAMHAADRIERLAADLDALSRRLQQAEANQAGIEQRRDENERTRAAQAADQLALARRGVEAGDHAVARLDEVLGVLGPRLDELEIKVRPLVEVDADSVAVRTADAYVMLPRAEPLFVTAVANATSGGLEPGVRRVLRALLRPGDAGADVGANVGLLTVPMAFAVGAAGRVWAFEPEARVRAQLARTLHLNGLAQVTLSAAAVGAEPGRLTFHESPIIGHSSLYALPEEERAGARMVEVEVTTLDAVVPPGTALAAVKIDVEGAELDVLRGMARVIADSPDLAIVAEFGPSHLRRVGITPDAWFAAFAAHGLAPRLIAEPAGTTAPAAAAELLDLESANLVFVRPGGAADGRLPR